MMISLVPTLIAVTCAAARNLAVVSYAAASPRGFKPVGMAGRVPGLFVAQGLDGVKAGSANGGNHSADQAYDAENDGGNDQGGGMDHEANIPGLGMLCHGAIEGEPADGKGHGVGQHDTEQPAHKSDGER